MALDLIRYGLDDHFIDESTIYEGLFIARISEQHREQYKVITEYGELGAVVSGKLAYSIFAATICSSFAVPAALRVKLLLRVSMWCMIACPLLSSTLSIITQSPTAGKNVLRTTRRCNVRWSMTG